VENIKLTLKTLCHTILFCNLCHKSCARTSRRDEWIGTLNNRPVPSNTNIFRQYFYSTECWSAYWNITPYIPFILVPDDGFVKVFFLDSLLFCLITSKMFYLRNFLQ
jgi:hypothetical protein